MPKTTKELEFHPVANLFPLMAPVNPDVDTEGAKTWADFVADIAENGQQEKGILYEGMILDGRNRYRACREAGVPFEYVEYKGDDPVSHVLSLNLERRHLTHDERVLLAYRLSHVKDEGEALGWQGFAESLSVPEASRRCRVAFSAVYDLAALVEGKKFRGTKVKAQPDLVEKIQTGQTKVRSEVRRAEAEVEKKAKAAVQKAATRKDGSKAAKIAAQQEIVGQAVALAVTRVRAAATALEAVTDAMATVGWDKLDPSQQDKLDAALAAFDTNRGRI